VATWSFLKGPGFHVRGTTWACSYLGGSIRLSGEHVGFIWLKEYYLRTFNLFSRFGLNKLETWTHPGLSKMAGISLEEHFQEFRLKGVADCAGTDR
jgi:hypothetical protein